MDDERAGGSPAARYDDDTDDTRSHLEWLLSRAGNARDLDGAVVARLRTALMHVVELHSLHRRNGPPHPVDHRTFKHVFLLPDGSSALLWEIEHTAGPDGGTLREVHADPRRAAEAERRLTAACGRDPSADPENPEDAEAERGLLAGVACDSLAGLAPWDALPPRHTYAADRSADHAWRVLRRAENADRPGGPVRRLLRSAVGHETTLVALRHDRVAGVSVDWSLYEHAFLLADGREVSLWELEHAFTADGHPVCEVYLDEATARDSLARRREAL